VDVLRPKPESPGSAFDAVGAGVRNGLYGSSQEEGKRGVRKMDQQDKLRAKLVEYVQNVHAMEQNVLLMLDTVILTTRDAELASMFEEHKVETRRHERRLNERLRALGGLSLTSTGKDLGAIAAAQVKGIADLWRTDKAVRNARDAFVTEHMEIAAYEVLERLAKRVGDAQTAEVARENRAEEEAMAERIASKWDSFLDMALSNE
jgi:ferritin-like metal-binding protein YciE